MMFYVFLFLVLSFVIAVLSNPHPLCSENEVIASCVNPIQATCSNPVPKMLVPICSQGCVCKPGYVREKARGLCIPLTDCIQSHPPQCGANEKRVLCASQCQPTCLSNSTLPRICSTICEEGCVCNPGYIRVSKNGICIPSSNCQRVCKENEYYNECGSACPKTCRDRNPKCNKRCVKGCFCKPGFVLSEKTKQCVRSLSCSIAE